MPLLINPETIIFDNDGTMYIINEDAKLVSLHDLQPLVEEDTSILTATAIEVADLGHGRPLGGKFDNDGCLYFADVIFGLNKICNISSEQGITPSSSVEVVASQVKLDDGTFSPINYADDVDIGPRTGHVYFSDASNIKPDRNIHGQWDILYASKKDRGSQGQFNREVTAIHTRDWCGRYPGHRCGICQWCGGGCR
jgi:sugar lactone lactonase YvrE